MCRGGSGLLWGCGAAVVQAWCRSGINALKLLAQIFSSNEEMF
jgi:hypothetical protein